MVPDSSTILRTYARQLPGAGGTGLDDVRKRAHVRVAERIDPARARFKPLSLLRQDARRTLEIYFDQDLPLFPKADRDRLIEEVVGEAFGPLEELFRDDGVKEILVLDPKKVIVRKDDAWTPTSVFFRDADHLRRTLARMADQGERLTVGPAAESAVETRLPNGFRLTAVIPPEIMDVTPIAAFLRTAPYVTPGPGGSLSKIATTPAPRIPRPGSGVIPPAPVRAPEFTEITPSPKADPNAKYRQRATESLVSKFAAAGVFDLSSVPKGELQRVVAAVVTDQNAMDRWGLTPIDCDRLTLEILSGMTQ
jgi:hypothetical protein